MHQGKSVRAADAVPGQGIVLLAGGAILQDGDDDGRLDVGETIDYHYTVINVGPAALSALTLSDSFGAVSCPLVALAVGAHMVCTSSHVVTAGDATNGAVINTASVSGQDDAARPVGASDVLLTQNLAGAAALHVFKSPDLVTDPDNSNGASEGDLLRYSFVIKNANAEDLSAVNLVEPDPLRIDTPITCAATTLGGSGFSGLGSGALASLDSVICTADYTITVADGTLGQVLNSVDATANATIAGAINASAASAVVVPLPPVADLAIDKQGPPLFQPGTDITFTIVVTNNGPDTAVNTILSDPTPPGLTWLSNSGDCVTAFPCALGDIVLDGSRTITSVFHIDANYSGPDPLINIASVSSDVTDPTPDNDASSASVPLITAPQPLESPAYIPAQDHWALWLNGILVGLLALGSLSLARRS
ncbi:MAG: hypothetical protein R3F22_12280 [Lysobacteraceae bacterium]